MNKRIKELMKQAMELKDPYAYEGDFGPKQLNAEKFAELIVRECADFLKDKLDDHFAAEQLEEHFGVEQ